MSTGFRTWLLLCLALAACRPGLSPSAQAPATENTSTPEEPLAAPSPPSSPHPSACLGEFARRSLAEPPADPGALTGHTLAPEQLADYLNIMGIDSICIPRELGPSSLNVDWYLPAAIGRMVSIGFQGLGGGASGWGRGYLVYSTYDFEVGSEYEVFATQEDLQATRTQSMPRMIITDGIDGFIRYFPGISMGEQPVYITYIFPFETSYLAAVLTLGQYDPAQVNDAILQMEEGSHPDLTNPDLPRFSELVSSIRFK